MTAYWLWMILIMFVATYPVRLMPFLTPVVRDLPEALHRMLRFVAPAALGALIIPDAFGSIQLTTADTLLGPVIVVPILAISAIAAVKTRKIVIPVFLAVTISYVVVSLGL